MSSRLMAMHVGQQSDGYAMPFDKLGLIVWHDLFTPDEDASRRFYERVAGWTYVTEHATNFAWGGGVRDFVLALSGSEAGAGFIGRSSEPFIGWMPYFEVRDVDATAEVASRNGGSVLRSPFEVPGVGRNCILRDPLGAHFGISLSKHTFSLPTKQFGIERYLLGEGTFPTEFYNRIFDWEMTFTSDGVAGSLRSTRIDDAIVFGISDMPSQDEQSAWLPSIRVACLKEAMAEVEAGDGAVLNSLPQQFARRAATLINDQHGTRAYLVEE